MIMDEEKFIEKNKDITHFTTFGISAKAAYFAEYQNVIQLEYLTRTQTYLNNEVLHIGGGSNLLFVSDFKGLVLHSKIKGMKRYEKDDENVYAIAGAGEKWTDFVDWCVREGLAGIENLAGIPGEVGASAVQNVGAYGVEAGDRIYSVECFDRETRRVVTLKKEECGFGYRESRFKHEWKDRYIVLRVAYKLEKSTLSSNLDYGPLKKLEEELGHHPSIQEVAEAVIKIRNSKLPDPTHIGSAGSFFKNPVVGRYFYEQEVLSRRYDVPCYEVDEHRVKIPAGWLIEHAGLKGKRIGGAEVYPKQCLVIANTGNATSSDVVKLSDFIKRRVSEEYGVSLRPEVNFVDTDIDVTVLGSGTSKGVPEVGCLCRVCRSDDPRDKRLRTTILVKTHGMTILLDASPDFREQALRENLDNVDALIITHSHYDHVGGIDDLRPFCADKRIPVYAAKDVNVDLHRRIDYCFKEHPYPGVPTFEMHEIDNEPFYINGLKIIPIRVMHGKLPIFGYRIGDFAFITDAKYIDDEEIDKLTGVKVLIINALREREHFAHLNVKEALEIIKRVNPEKAYLTHFNHEIKHSELEEKLPPNVKPAYDGLHIRIK